MVGLAFISEKIVGQARCVEPVGDVGDDAVLEDAGAADDEGLLEAAGLDLAGYLGHGAGAVIGGLVEHDAIGHVYFSFPCTVNSDFFNWYYYNAC